MVIFTLLFMVVYLLISKHWIKFEPLNGIRKFPIKEHFVIWFGQILKMWILGQSRGAGWLFGAKVTK